MNGIPVSSCPACGASGRTASWRRAHIRLVECSRCGLVFADPQFREIVNRRYESEYDLAAHFGEREARKRVLYQRRLRSLASPASGGGLLCDVGCGDGQFLALAREQGWHGRGVELNPAAAEAVRRRGFPVHVGRIEDAAALEWGGFDLVTAWDSLEHVPDPRAFVRQLVRLLRPGGTVALSTLNRRSLVAAVFRQHWTMVVEDHYTYWDRSSLHRMLESEGVEVVRSSTSGLGRDFFRWLDRPARLGTGSTGATGERRGWDASRPVAAIEAVVNAGLARSGAGVSLDVIGRRPASV